MVPPAFVLASGYYYTGALLPVAILFSRRRSSISSSPTMESQRKPPPASSSSSASLLAAASIDDAWDHGDGRRTRAAGKGKPRVLCLHGYCQSGRAFSNKIAGARRKLDRAYDLTFLDGPMLLPLPSTSAGDDNDDDDGSLLLSPRGWWRRSEATGEYTHVREAFEYVLRHVEEEGERYDAVIGFSQGGTLATSLAVSGVLGPDLRAVVTAGAPYVDEAFVVASELRRSSSSPSPSSSSSSSSAPNDDEVEGCHDHDAVPKLHFAGSTDALVSMESTAELCRRGGGGTLVVHDRGHMFPTRSANVREVLDFLDAALSSHRGDGM